MHVRFGSNSNRPRVTIITDDNVGPHYLDVLIKNVLMGYRSDAWLPAGEATNHGLFLLNQLIGYLRKNRTYLLLLFLEF